jgi:hypothetical protein
VPAAAAGHAVPVLRLHHPPPPAPGSIDASLSDCRRLHCAAEGALEILLRAARRGGERRSDRGEYVGSWDLPGGIEQVFLALALFEERRGRRCGNWSSSLSGRVGPLLQLC